MENAKRLNNRELVIGGGNEQELDSAEKCNVAPKTRIAGIDLVRVIAILFVIANHFLVCNTPFYGSVFNSVSMFLQSVGNSIMYGVPLFILITGYLNCNKKLTRQYYRSLVRVLSAYLFFSIVTILFRIYYLGEQNSIYEWTTEILKFSAIPYGWYIEMWIGLFLLTPFLNLLWHNLPTKRAKQVLIGTISLLTVLPLFTNSHTHYIFPGYWETCYPLAYYFTGCYIREYKPKYNKKWLSVLILTLGSTNGLFTLLFTDCKHIYPITGGHYGLIGAAITVSLFLILYDIDIKGNVLKNVFSRIAELSLDMYLCCWMVDQLVYPYFIDRYYESQSQFGVYIFVIVPILFILSLFLAYVKKLVFKVIKLG